LYFHSDMQYSTKCGKFALPFVMRAGQEKPFLALLIVHDILLGSYLCVCW
jgi:hypothetical protein